MTETNSTATWPQEELARIGAAAEIGLASRRQDGSLRPYVTMWAVRAGDALYVRSAYGPEIVGSVTGPGAYDVTVRLVPQPGGEEERR